MDLKQYIINQIRWSSKAFGPGKLDAQIIDHIKSELSEIEKAPGDLMEWVDVISLAFDGAWRNGHTHSEIADAMEKKQDINRNRKWPHWRKAEPGKKIARSGWNFIPARRAPLTCHT